MSFIQRFSVAFFSTIRWFFTRIGSRLRRSPRWGSWFYPTRPVETDESRYREFNHRTFSDFHNQECMLADGPRMAFYREAIRRHVKPGDRVIDLGTGTGILAAFAAWNGAAKVYAVDHSDILERAKLLAADNGIENVDFVALHSTDFDLGERVDVIVHEQMGDFLFDESMVPNVCDLRDRVLKPGGLILPSRFEFFCEPVSLKAERRVPFIWELNVHGYDYSGLNAHRPEESEYYRMASCDLGVVAHFVGEPEAALSFDLHTIDEETLPRRLQFRRTVKTAGGIDGLAVFMNVKVDEDMNLSSSPLEQGRAPHWAFRILRLEREELKVGQVLEVILDVGEWEDPDTWQWTCTMIAEAPNVVRPAMDLVVA